MPAACWQFTVHCFDEMQARETHPFGRVNARWLDNRAARAGEEPSWIPYLRNRELEVYRVGADESEEQLPGVSLVSCRGWQCKV